MAATVVLVPGAFCGSWIYWRLLPELAARGIDAVPVDLPTIGASDASVGVPDDVAHVGSVVASVGGPVVLVGSSYGGAVITGVDHPDVRRLVYVAAGMPKAGESVMGTLGASMTPEFGKGMRPLSDGTIDFDVEVGVQTAFQQASPEAQDRWRANAKPMSFGPDPHFALDSAAWEKVPATYVLCTEDLAVRPDSQREWAKERAEEVLEFPFDHSPGVSHPVEIAEVLTRLAQEASG